MTAPALGAYRSPRGTQSGGDLRVRDLIIDITLEYENARPRTQQKELGPSEIGEPCARKLAYKISQFPEPVDYVDDPWFAMMGTAVHTMMGEILDRQNRLAVARGEAPPWRIEERVTAMNKVTGSADALYIPWNLVIDFKVVGKTSHTKYRRHGPSKVYKTQFHTYGVGARDKGFTVDQVSLVLLPRFDNITRSLHVITEDLDPSVVEKALLRIDIITELVRQLNPAMNPEQFKQFPSLPTEDCRLCPWNKPGLDSGASCPGNLKI